MKKKGIYAAALCLSLLLAGCNNQAGFYVEQTDEEIIADTPVEKPQEEEIDKAVDIYVQVSGAVLCPGVYSLKAGSRIFEAIELAGGLTAEADQATLNQADICSDGMMIYVSKPGENAADASTPQEAGDAKVNINTADANTLMTLPGIGQSKADSIIAWRKEHGAFQKPEELMEIPGVKEGVFNKLKDHIKIN